MKNKTISVHFKAKLRFPFLIGSVVDSSIYKTTNIYQSFVYPFSKEIFHSPC